MIALSSVNASLSTFSDEIVTSISPPIADASTRVYHRLHTRGGITLVLCDYTRASDATAEEFIQITALLEKNGQNVPEVIGYDQSNKWMYLSDLGNEDLQSLFTKDYAAGLKALEKALALLPGLQKIHPPEFVQERRFDYDKLYFEMDFLMQRLNNARLPVATAFHKRLQEICHELDTRDSFILCHRDFHSHNLLLHGGHWYMIDYQDARLGLPAYDAASLIFDPYIPLDFARRIPLARKWVSENEKVNLQIFYQQALQRLLKALGTYLFQVFEKENYIFQDSINTATEMLMQLSELLGENSIA